MRVGFFLDIMSVLWYYTPMIKIGIIKNKRLQFGTWERPNLKPRGKKFVYNIFVATDEIGASDYPISMLRYRTHKAAAKTLCTLHAMVNRDVPYDQIREWFLGADWNWKQTINKDFSPSDWMGDDEFLHAVEHKYYEEVEKTSYHELL